MNHSTSSLGKRIKSAVTNRKRGADGLVRGASPMSRRGFLALGGAAAGTALLPGCGRAESAAVAAEAVAVAGGKAEQPPKNVIMMVADGMSMGVTTLAEPFSQMTRKRGTHWYELLQSPTTIHGLLRTDSLSGLVTDSSAAASAWGSGTRVLNGSLNMLPDGSRLTPMAVLAKDAGKRVGLVTTDEVVGATPAGFAVVQKKRNESDQIAVQFVDVVDVLMGGGREHFDALSREDGQDLIGMFKTRGYQFMDDRSQLLASKPTSKVLGLFGEGKLPYTVDHMQDGQARKQVPTLPEMTRHALDSLAGEHKGFFLMVEGARVDHAAHHNDAGSIFWEQLLFDDAVAVATSFAAQRDDTLVIVTTDHGNGNPGLNGMGSGYSDSNTCFERLAGITGSFGRIRSRIKSEARTASPADAARAGIAQLTNIEIQDDEAQVLARAIFDGDAKSEVYRHHQSIDGLLGQVMGNYHGISWTSPSHTADCVLLSAIGPAAKRFEGLGHHVDVHRKIVELLGLRSSATISAG